MPKLMIQLNFSDGAKKRITDGHTKKEISIILNKERDILRNGCLNMPNCIGWEIVKFDESVEIVGIV